MHDKDHARRGAGPHTFESPALASGEEWRIDLQSKEKGKYHRFAPYDSLLVKNYDDSNRIDLEINGKSNQYVDIAPNGSDTYSETDIRLFKVTNQGSTQIPSDSITVTVKKDPFDADDRAREQEFQPLPVKLGKGLLGL